MEPGTQIIFRSEVACTIRLKNGRYKKVSLPKFKHQQFVRTSKKHYSQKNFTMVLEPTWSETRGWIYGEKYINRNGEGGGTGWWNNEDLYESLENPIDIMIARRLTLQEEEQGCEHKIKTINIELEHLSYAIVLASNN